MNPFFEIRTKIVFDLLDKFPEASSRCLAVILFRDHPDMFKNYEDARYVIRYYRGSTGAHKSSKLKEKKYVRKPV